ncbi:hypothetical protein MMC30_005621 [Trapelia coarctata]|nr:hypothetical protein [Trapelia coarctata]
MDQEVPEFVTQVSGGKLCENCQEMEIESFFKGRSKTATSQEGSSADSDEEENFLRTLPDMLQEKECPFCRFLVEVLRLEYQAENLPDPVWEDGLYEGKPILCDFDNEELVQNYCFTKEVALDFWELNKPAYPYQMDLSTIPDLRNTDNPVENFTRIQILSHRPVSLDVSPRDGQGCLVPVVLDVSRARRWLDTCERRHPYTAAGTHLYPEFRVIDLDRGCIIHATRPCRYVTLSYLWGTKQTLTLRRDTFDILHKEGNLTPYTEGLAKTIQDTMLLTKAIGERFLWVDALCIVQDDNSDKGIQINAMDRVYERSVLTIVACHGTDANAGLPGMRKGSRSPEQLTCMLEGLTLKSCMPPLEILNARTKWNTRGWTYQEAVIANRLLYVTTNQIYYECKKGCKVHEEAMEEEVPPGTPGSKDIFPYRIDAIQAGGDFATFEHILTEFTKRTLTDSYDVLNALTGIFNRLQAIYGDYPYAYGLPTSAFDAALLWKPKYSCHRRTDAQGKTVFPSWTWAGWEGEIEYGNIYSYGETLQSRLIWDRNEPVYAAQDIERNRSDTLHTSSGQRLWERNSTPAFEAEMVYYLECGSINRDVRFSRPVADADVSAIRSALDPETGHLRFHAETAFFTLTGEFTKAVHEELLRERNNELSALSILDANGNLAGTVLVDDWIARTLPPGQHEFLTLSRTTLSHSQKDPSWDASTKTFPYPSQEGTQPVPVETEPNYWLQKSMRYFDHSVFDAYKVWPLYNVLLVERRDGIVYRLGLGKIHIDAFDPVAERKDIVLG